MNFEIMPNNNPETETLGVAKLSKVEREILNKAVSDRIYRAALLGGTQLSECSLTKFYRHTYNMKSFAALLIIKVNLELAEDFVDALDGYSRDAKVNIGETEQLFMEFIQAKDLLAENENSLYIEEEVALLEIPDNLSGLI